jgi:transcriptional regulator with XRE-family HTH domain
MPQVSGPHALDVAIGQRIREQRRSAGLSQASLADAIGVTFQQIQKYERGANRISFSRLAGVAVALGCRVSDLAEGLDGAGAAEQVRGLNELVGVSGALELLEAYAAIDSLGLRKALIAHARSLSRLQDGPEA